MIRHTTQWLLAAVVLSAATNTAHADTCDKIGGMPGVYLKQLNGMPKKLEGNVSFQYYDNMWLWVIPDRPDPGLEVTWHVLVQGRKNRETPLEDIAVRRNKVFTTCPQEHGNDPSREFGTLIAKDDSSATFTYPDHNDYVGSGRLRHAPNNAAIRKWHFNWRQAKNSCPYTADHVEKALDIDNNEIKTAAKFDVGLDAKAKPAVKTRRYTTVTSALVHRRDESAFCYKFPLRAPHGPEGETRIKVKKLLGGRSQTFTVTWTK